MEGPMVTFLFCHSRLVLTRLELGAIAVGKILLKANGTYLRLRQMFQWICR